MDTKAMVSWCDRWWGSRLGWAEDSVKPQRRKTFWWYWGCRWKRWCHRYERGGPSFIFHDHPHHVSLINARFSSSSRVPWTSPWALSGPDPNYVPVLCLCRIPLLRWKLECTFSCLTPLQTEHLKSEQSDDELLRACYGPALPEDWTQISFFLLPRGHLSQVW